MGVGSFFSGEGQIVDFFIGIQKDFQEGP